MQIYRQYHEEQIISDTSFPMPKQPNDGRTVIRDMGTSEEIVYSTISGSRRYSTSEANYVKTLAMHDNRVTHDPDDDLQPLTARVKTKSTPVKQGVPKFKKCVKDGMIVMNPYKAAKREGNIPISFVVEERLTNEIRRPYMEKRRRVYRTIRRSRPNNPNNWVEGRWIEREEVTVLFKWETEFRSTRHGLALSDFGETNRKTYGDLVAISAMKDRTLQSLWNEANSGIFDLLTNVGETPETVKAMKDLRKAPHLITAYKKALTRKNRKRAIKEASGNAADHTASAWLIYRLGILPLDGAVQDAIDAYNKPRNIKFQTYRNGEGAKRGLKIESVHKDLKLSLHYTSEQLFKVNNVIKAKLQGTEVPSMTVNVPLTAWELVPYSFVVDRFINLGDHIASLGNRSHSVATQGCTSVKTVQTDTYELLVDEPNLITTEGTLENYYGEYRRTIKNLVPIGETVTKVVESSIDRTVFSGKPNTNLALKFKLTSNQHKDHIALAWSYIRSKLRRS